MISMTTKYNFDAAVDDAKKRIQLLIPNADCIAWRDYSDKGSACYNPLVFSNISEIYDDAFWLGVVKAAMPRGSKSHELLAPRVALQLGCRWITYDSLIKHIARLFNGCDLDEFGEMIALSRAVRDGMIKKGITTITSLSDALE